MVSKRLFFIIKRATDILFSLISLALTAPFWLATALIIKIASPNAPVFFSHNRLGKDGKPFKCYKFRTMAPNADVLLKEHLAAHPDLRKEYETTFKLKLDPRVIPVIGSFLRSTSFDEVPQFVNVLKGEMSIVGPRPITEPEIHFYGPYFKEVFSVKPGITGLWQISGRNDVAYEERVRLDREYVNSLSLRKDFVVGLRTIKIILTGKGY